MPIEMTQHTLINPLTLNPLPLRGNDEAVSPMNGGKEANAPQYVPAPLQGRKGAFEKRLDELKFL
jgi:hypothetical protein